MQEAHKPKFLNSYLSNHPTLLFYSVASCCHPAISSNQPDGLSLLGVGVEEISTPIMVFPVSWFERKAEWYVGEIKVLLEGNVPHSALCLPFLSISFFFKKISGQYQ